MKKIVSLLMALTMVLSLSTAAFAAENQNASFTKTYKAENEGTKNPAETFTFTFTNGTVSGNTNVTAAPAIPDATVAFDAETATAAGLAKDVNVALANIQWPGVGVYVYDVNETAGTTAGVVYDGTTAKLKVTVAYDEGTHTYYTAFVTLSLADENDDGITDVKTGGFTNVYQAGNLSFSKTVTGNMGNKEEFFDVVVTLTGEEGKTYAASYDVSGGSNESNPETVAINGTYTFKVKHGDTITIENLPYGVTYTVNETEPGNGYTATHVYSDEGQTKVVDTASETVSITNNKGTTVDTGVILDNAPYILLLAAVAVGLAVCFTKKREF